MALGDSPYKGIISDISNVVGQQGYAAQLYQAVTCPCGNAPGSSSNINCEACHGLGMLYPTAPITVMCMVSDATQETDMNDQGYGLAQYGDIILYPDPNGPRLSTFDLVILPTLVSFPTYSETIVRGSGATDTADYNISSADGVWTVVSGTGVSTAYAPGTDFTVSGKTITWVGPAPAQGTMYSLRYGAQFEWVAFEPPTPRLVFGQDLGQIVPMRKRHVVFPGLPSPIGA